MGAGRKPRPRYYEERKAVPIYEYECRKCSRVTESGSPQTGHVLSIAFIENCHLRD